MCLVPQADLMALLAAHHDLQMELRKLQARCPERQS
jgi:hypothetical protein